MVGLDPAGPGFNEAPEWSRLDPGDATIVDIIHTSMQVLSLSHPVGHVDFYPNGGRAQPGCPDIFNYLSKFVFIWYTKTLNKTFYNKNTTNIFFLI